MTTAWANELEKVPCRAHRTRINVTDPRVRVTRATAAQWVPDLDPTRVVVTRSGKDAARLQGAHVMVVPYSQFRDKSRIMPELHRIVRLRSCVACPVVGCGSMGWWYGAHGCPCPCAATAHRHCRRVALPEEQGRPAHEGSDRHCGEGRARHPAVRYGTATAARPAPAVVPLCVQACVGCDHTPTAHLPSHDDVCVVRQARRRWLALWSCTRSSVS